MKLITFTLDGSTRTGAITDEQHLVDLHATDPAIPADMLALLAGGDAMLDRARNALKNAGSRIPVSAVTIEAPIARPGKALAIGLNYRDHAAEGGQEIPSKPVVFAKVTTCITGPGKPIHRPRVSTSVDWEAELVFVIGRAARHVSAADALDYVAGYMCGNDVSVRDWQFHAPTWTMGKGFDTHGPIGPWLVTRDEVDASNLGIRTYLNGELKQQSNTGQLIFSVPALIEYLSTAFTLEPGDIVFTGTPAGVGVSRKPPEFMKAGDTVRVEIDGLGVLENPVIDEPQY
jgi:2-keto-4-pentenoate hydratase/2-oxohepta-3-ene-1,7-dioic acid hydratase in catechol pathway